MALGSNMVLRPDRSAVGPGALAEILRQIRHRVDTRGHGVRVELDATQGPFCGPVDITGPLPGGGRLTLSGVNGSARITSGRNFVLRARNMAEIWLENLILDTARDGITSCLVAAAGGRAAIGPGVTFGTCSNAHIEATRGGEVAAEADYRIAGSARSHLHAVRGGVIAIDGRQIALAPEVAFSTYFLGCSFGFVSLRGGTAFEFEGTSPGHRFIVHLNGVVRVDPGASLDAMLPGDLPGSTKDGGVILGQPGRLATLTEDQVSALESPPVGTILFNTTSGKIQIWTGKDWQTLAAE
ncbi:MAG: hypothetical protein ACWA5A_10305 [Marinibacterium sp.]